MNRLRTILVIITMLPAIHALAQRPVANADFTWLFDNREYKSDFARSQTIFGMRFTPEAGLKWEDNSIMVGTQLYSDFGSTTDEIEPVILIYYNYNTPRFNISAGRFARTQVIGDYSNAFIGSSVKFYRGYLEGVLAQWKGPLGYFELICDWDSRQTDTRREKFTIFSAAEVGSKGFFAGYNFSMHHHAGTALDGGVTDNIWAYPHVGFRREGLLGLRDKFSVRGGPLMSFQNERSIGEADYITPRGWQVEARLEILRFGIFNTLYKGDNLMPYYDLHGGGLYWGNPFYRTTLGTYDRLELYWSPIQKRDMELRFSSVHHYDGAGWSWQQRVHFAIRVGSDYKKR